MSFQRKREYSGGILIKRLAWIYKRDDTSWRFKEEPHAEAAWNPPWTAQPLRVGVGDTDTWCIRLCAARNDISHLRSRLHGWINKRRFTAGTVKRFILKRKTLFFFKQQLNGLLWDVSKQSTVYSINYRQHKLDPTLYYSASAMHENSIIREAFCHFILCGIVRATLS